MENIEILGIIASIVVFIGFTRTDVKEIRLISGLACILWTIYGIYINSVSVVFMNIAILGLHIYKILKK